MDLFPTLTITAQPDNAFLAEHELVPDPEKKLLVVYESDLPFLQRVLTAAGYKDPNADLHLLRREASDPDLDLATLVRGLGVGQVILFGQELNSLGLHFVIARYAPVEIAGTRYMVCPGVGEVAGAKKRGDKRPSLDLWRGLQAGFLKTSDQAEG